MLEEVRMSYIFDILGVSPLLDFFTQQQTIQKKTANLDLEYLGIYTCTLDSFLESVETVSVQKNWEMDRVVDTVINFWMNNEEKVSYWTERLEDAGHENLLVARVGDIKGLKITFESLINFKF